MWAPDAWNTGLMQQFAPEPAPSAVLSFANAHSIVESSKGLKAGMLVTARLAMTWIRLRGASRIVARDQATLLRDCGCASPTSRLPKADSMASRRPFMTGCLSSLACPTRSRDESFANRWIAVDRLTRFMCSRWLATTSSRLSSPPWSAAEMIWPLIHWKEYRLPMYFTLLWRWPPLGPSLQGIKIYSFLGGQIFDLTRRWPRPDVRATC
mmetsp:Transcript_46734/g.138049  ORF Transcript_46734/g.138049 Transcript_46734/m.138049 type:complete len:210 (+) Transcript_46734:2106-2735(+)